MDKTIASCGLTLAVLVLLIFSQPFKTIAQIEDENIIYAREMCLKGESVDNSRILYSAKLGMQWNNQTNTCYCRSYYVKLDEECNITNYWFIPSEAYFYPEGMSLESYNPEVKWCDLRQPINCTKPKYRLIYQNVIYSNSKGETTTQNITERLD
jgi:hypothetical protein